MKKTLLFAIAVFLSFSVIFNFGCAKKANSPNEAIQNSQSLKTVEEKADYLITQAKAFYNSRQFKQAVETAQYVLSNLDHNSQPAKDLIEKAKTQLQAAAQKAGADASKKIFGQ